MSRTVPVQCTVSASQIVVPQVTPYLGNHTKLIVTTLNDNNGIMYSIAGTHDFKLVTYGGQNETIPIVITKSKFQAFTTNTIITNSQAKTLISVSFTPKTSAASFKLLFPLHDPYNKSRPVYSADLGSGLLNGSSASCFGRTGFAVGTLTCTLLTGTIRTGSTTISINSAISAGTAYTFEVDSIITPAIFVNDYTWVHHVLESYSAGALLLDRSIYYDYTVKNIAYGYTAISPAPSTSTIVIEDTGVSFNFSLKNYVATGSADYLIIEFPQDYYKPIPQLINYNSSVQTWVSSGNNWVIHKLPSGLAANSAVNVRLLDCVNSFVVTTKIVFTVYHVQDRVIVRAYTMAPMAQLTVPSGKVYVDPVVPAVTTDGDITRVDIEGLYDGIGMQIIQSTVQLKTIMNNSFSLHLSVPVNFFSIYQAYSSANSSAVVGST